MQTFADRNASGQALAAAFFELLQAAGGKPKAARGQELRAAGRTSRGPAGSIDPQVTKGAAGCALPRAASLTLPGTALAQSVDGSTDPVPACVEALYRSPAGPAVER